MAISIMFLLLKMSVACTGCGYGDFLILKLILYQQGWYQVLFASNPVLKQRQELHSTENPELVFAFKKPKNTDLRQSISLHTDELLVWQDVIPFS